MSAFRCAGDTPAVRLQDTSEQFEQGAFAAAVASGNACPAFRNLKREIFKQACCRSRVGKVEFCDVNRHYGLLMVRMPAAACGPSQATGLVTKRKAVSLKTALA